MRLNSAQIEQASIIWVLVANGGRAQIYRYHPNKALMPMHDSKREPYEQEMKRHELTPVPEMTFQAESLKDFQVGHDSRGSKIGGVSPGHNTCEPHLDIHDEVKQNLVKDITDKLKHAYETKAFDHLVIAASPKILGALRLHLGTAVSGHVIAEIDKDFTSDKSHALLAHLQETFAGAHI
jgi:protein required for attachment to host cells